MRTKLLCAAGLIAAVGAIITATPAFTADNAALDVTVKAQLACVTFADSPGTQVDFGTLPFATGADSPVGLATGATRPRYSNCSPAREDLYIAGGAAHNTCGSSCTAHTWAVGGAEGECPTLNSYQLWYFVDNTGTDIAGAWLRTTNIPLRKAPGGSFSYGSNEAHNLALTIKMPCQGSDGAGEPFTLPVTVTAVIP
jgi:hypothetical protein